MGSGKSKTVYDAGWTIQYYVYVPHNTIMFRQSNGTVYKYLGKILQELGLILFLFFMKEYTKIRDTLMIAFMYQLNGVPATVPYL